MMDLEISSFPFLISFIFFVFMVLTIGKKKSINNHPPGPWSLPLIGNLHQLASSQPHHRLTELAKIYGPLMHIQLGQVPAVIISSAELAKQVLQTQESHFLERPFLLAADIMLYNRTDIIFAPYGVYWREMKKIAILELLSAKRVQSFKSIREEQVSNFIKFIYLKTGSPVNLSKELMSLANSTIAITSIGKKFNKQEKIIGVITDAIMAAGGFSVADAFPSFKFLHLITGMSSKIHRIHRQADEILEDIIIEHKANQPAAVSKADADNILDVLLAVQEEGNFRFHLTTDNIKAMILEMFGAASDTSSVTIEWAMSEMMKNPRVMIKAQEEVRRVFSEKGNVDEDGLHELKYFKLIIKETLRLHPPLALIPRECREKCQVSGYDIHPKTKVLINVWAIGRDPNSWTDPERFYPERFVESSIDFKGNDYEFLPFGAGKRICPGITMAMANIQLTIAQMLYHFDWKLPDGAESECIDMTESFGLAIKRKTDLNLIPIPYP